MPSNVRCFQIAALLLASSGPAVVNAATIPNCASAATDLSPLATPALNYSASVDASGVGPSTIDNFGDPIPIPNTVWYTFTAPSNGVFRYKETGPTGTYLLVSTSCDDASFFSLTNNNNAPASMADSNSVSNFNHVNGGMTLTAGQTLKIGVGAFPGAYAGNYELMFTFTPPAAPPANDVCSGAIGIGALSSPFVGDVSIPNATDDAVSMPCATEGTARHGVWYTYTTTAAHEYIRFESNYFNQNAGDREAVLGVYSGSCGSLTPVCCSISGGSTVIDLATPGTYFFMVSAKDSGGLTASNARYEFTITSLGNGAAAASNGSCGSASSIASLSAPLHVVANISGLNDAGAAPSCQEASTGCRTQGRSVWYTYNGSANEYLRFTHATGGDNRAAVMSVYSGTCGSLASVGCVTINRNLRLPSSGQYLIQITEQYLNSDISPSTRFDFTLSSLGIGSVPGNDACGGAVSVPGLPYTNTVTVGGAGNDQDTGCNASGSSFTSRGVWYRYVSPSDQYVAVLPTSAAGDLRVATVYEGSCGGAELYCGDLVSGGVVFFAEAGLTYTVLIGDYLNFEQSNNQYLPTDFNTVKFAGAQSLSNDLCANAVVVASLPYTTVIDGGTATADPSIAGCNPGEPLYGSVYFKFTAATNGKVAITNIAEYDGATAALYTGTCSGLAVARCQTVGTEAQKLVADVTAGTTYTLALGSTVGIGTMIRGINDVSIAYFCPADFNGDSVRDVADLFAYINAWLAKTANADFNNDSTVDVADLFAYINAWLAGC